MSNDSTNNFSILNFDGQSCDLMATTTFLLLVVILLFVGLTFARVQEAADGSVCVNHCNGHGTCIDYSCHCFPGYSGDDCGVSFLEEGQIVVPILTAGHFNLTSKNFSSTISKNKFILVGFSANSCHKCITVEPEYEKIAMALKEKDIPFARADLIQ